MPIITRLSTQKRGNRYNVYIDDRYAFSVDEDILIKFNLRKGLKLDDDTIKLITEQDETQKYYLQVIRYLSYRMRTEKEIKDYLIKQEANDDQIDMIVDRLKKEKLIDDQEFADLFVTSRIRTTLKGPKLIQLELRQKGISDHMAQEALRLFDKVTQYEKAYKQVEKRGKHTSNRSFKKQLEHLKTMLRRNGFTEDIIHDVVSDINDQVDHEAEWQALCYQGEKYLRKYVRKHSGYELRMKIKGALYRQGFTIGLIDRFINESIKDNDYDE